MFVQAVEIFAFITGLIYIVLEIKQSRVMWIVGILTGVACAASFAVQHLYASMALNIYYALVSVWGLREWKIASSKTKADIHLDRLSKRVVWNSVLVMLAGTAGLTLVLDLVGDSMTLMDSFVAMLSVVGTWWLAKSYPEQWLLWIIADFLSTILCLFSGMYWMAVLYIAYTFSAFYGYYHWRKYGDYVD